ncbi:MAG: hypothetical protein ABSA32_14410, partial [Candidatus Acidiferrales bacterium]
MERDLNLAAFSLDPLIPKGNVDIVHELGKSLATYGHDFRKFFVDQIEFAAVEPETTALLAMMKDDIGLVQESYGMQNGVVAAWAFANLLFGFRNWILRTVLDASLHLKSHLVQLAFIQ